MAKAGSVMQFILKQLLRSVDVNALTAELGADPIIGHNENDGTRCDFDLGSPVSGTIGHVVKHIYQREGFKIKTINSSGVVVHSADVTSINTIDIPIGGVIWWHKSLTGVPSLPSGWVECNGQVLSDPESLLNGRTIPNINGSKYFIRGGATSGGTQANQMKSHTHTASLASTALTCSSALTIQGQPSKVIGNGEISSFYLPTGSAHFPAYIWRDPSESIAATEITSKVALASGSVNVTATPAGSPDETRPDNITLVAIMRVK
jgi:hypothetical protein